MTGILLAIDTSTSAASLALATSSETIAEYDWSVEQRHSTELLQRLEWLLATTGMRPDALTGIAVATGPGSFNGLRVALSTAKSLALALGLPLYGVPTLDVTAWGYAYAQGPVWALLEAGRGQVYAARYTTPAWSADGWGPVGEHAVLTLGEVAARVREELGEGSDSALFCGEWRAQTRETLEGELGEHAHFASPLRTRRAVWLAELAFARAAQGLQESPAALEPLYVRRPAITKSSKPGIAPQAGQGEAERASGEDSTGEREEVSHALRD